MQAIANLQGTSGPADDLEPQFAIDPSAHMV
jgi:hypothetical protein